MTLPRLIALAAVSLALFAQPSSPSAAELGRQISASGLDAAACFRVRDLEIDQEDAQFYLTEGYLIFGKLVNGAPVSAVFSADVEGGDGEVLMLPPNRSERKSLAGYTGAPNLDEHFTNAVFIFTEAKARRLEAELLARPEVRRAPDVGAALADQWSPTVVNLTASFESRLVLDLKSGKAQDRLGFFTALVQGRKLGNFDLGYDGRGAEQLYAGRVTTRDGKTFFDTWTSFASRTHRGDQQPPAPEEEILSYRIDATLDSSLVLHCVTRLRFRATAESQMVLPFDLSAQMHPTGASVDGAPAEVYQRDSVRRGLVQNNGDELVLVIPPQPLDPGSEHEVEIHHEGKVVVDAGHQVYFVNARGTWYPDRGAQFAAYDVTFHYPKNLDLISAGNVTEDRIEGETRITRRVPAGRVRLLAFNLGVYEKKQTEHNGIQIEVSANREVEDALRYRQPDPLPVSTASQGDRLRRLPRGLKDPGISADAVDANGNLVEPVNPVNQLARVADDMDAAVEFYRARFGDPPLKRIEVSPVPGRFGQGFAGMIYLSTLSYLPATARPLALMPPWQQVFYGELLRAHEAAHQWWGNIVTTGAYRHEWLMEALANYSAMMFIESRNPKIFDTLMNQYKVDLLAKGLDGQTTESEGPVVQGRRLETSNNPYAWNAIAYGKGTWILHMLRGRMGDAQFLKMLAELRHRYEWKTIDTEQFRLLCAEFVPPNSPDPKLENFFDQWVYGTGIPTLKITYSVKGKPGAYKLSGTITQADVPEDFSVTVPVEIQTGRGKAVKLLQTSSEPVPFSFPVTAATAKAVLDPASGILRR